jgi:ABC-2 type transport system ATP-binding protein
MIRVNNLRKSFDEHLVLEDINMTIEPGKIYGLVGSNGCGKTTILKHMMSIYKADSGQILYGDVCISDDDYLNKIYYVQDDLFFPMNYSLDDLFDYEKMMYSTMSEKKFQQLKEYFKLAGDKKLRSLSKGQKKQAAFILAIASMTETVLLDEIVDGLDAVVRKKFWQVIMSEVMDRQLTLVISSHALTELDNICDRVGILHDGKIVREDDIDLIKEQTKRVQFAIKGDFEGLVSEEFEIVKDSLIGKVHFAVIRGNVEKFKAMLEAKHEVLLYDVLMMNLEEIFISELGGLGYGIEEYVSD